MEHFYQKIDGYATFNDQGQLMDTILENLGLKNNLKIAEIGVYQGRLTALWNVELLNKNIEYEYFAIDHFSGSSEHNPNLDYFGITINNLKPILDKVNIIKNNSVSESKNYINEFFDIIYIDASHEYEFVKEDILTWLPKVKSGGIICGDDYIKGWPGVIKAVDEIFGCNVKHIGTQQWWINKK